MTAIELLPAGHRLSLICVSLTKRALLSSGIKPAEKLRFLEFLDAFSDPYMKPEMVAMIEPLNDKGYTIYAEAKSLDPPGDKSADASFRVMTSEKVFGHFLTLNPSILKAIEWRETSQRKAATSPAAMPSPQPAPPPAPRPAYGSEIPDRFMQREGAR